MIKILKFGEVDMAQIFARPQSEVDVAGIVGEIIENVKSQGDQALYAYAKAFDKAELDSLIVSEEEMEEAVRSVAPEFLEILRKASANIEAFHAKQVRSGFSIEKKDGIIVGQKITPVDRAGLYVPGGTAAYPSTVLMDAIPAKIAGCREVVMVTPPNREGKINPVILAAAKIAGIDKIFKVGGAQAIAALAYGTESIPKVDKIVGPGNAFVAEAKKQVFGKVSIDMIAGPSEILIIADKSARASFVAADLLSQAEHDKMASAVLITDSMPLALEVQQELQRQLPALSRYDIANVSIENNGKIIVVQDIRQGIEVSNEIAPEHLELCVKDPFACLDQIRHAGSIFMGHYCPEALGDYYAGPNHTLPTGGSAKFSSPLGVDDFIKKTQFTYYPPEALKASALDISYFANAEGLTAHGLSATIRLEESEL